MLHLHLAQSTIYISPSPSTRPACFERLSNPHSNGVGSDEEEADVFQSTGELYLTEREVAFIAAKSGTGFKLGYANIALHAVSRSPPGFLSSSIADFHGCLYCQLDLSPNAGTAEMGEDDEEREFVEMYICTKDSAELDQLFEALSHCASLHPSGPIEDDGAGHPFAGFAPFGTSASGVQLGEEDQDGAFDDADDNDELSETGRVRTDKTPDSRYRPY